MRFIIIDHQFLLAANPGILLSVQTFVDRLVESTMETKRNQTLFRTQLIYMLLPIIFLPSLVVGFFSYEVSYNALQSRSTRDVGRISDLVNQNLDIVLQNMMQLAKSPLYDSDIQQILSYYSQHPDVTYADPKDVAAMDQFLYNLESSNRAVQSVFMYTRGNVYFSTSFTGSKIGDQYWKKQPWFQEAIVSSDKDVVLIPTHQVDQYAYADDSPQTSVFSLVRQIKDTSNFQVVGIILINLDMEVIQRVIETSQENSDTHFIIYDSSGQWIYPAQGDAFREEINDLTPIKQALMQGDKQFSWKGKPYFVSGRKSDYSNWTVVAMVPKSSLTESIQPIMWATLAVVGLTVCVAMISFFVLIMRISKPISQLSRLIKRLEMGDMEVRFDAKSRGEIFMLGHSFNHMVVRLKELIQNNYEMQIVRQRAELAALRSQINPHFLYNTLESFQLIALMEGSDRLARMSYALGQLMRYALQADDMITLNQELTHIRNYLTLIKERYEDRIVYTVEMPDHLNDYKIPKLSLQPIVENAVYHGIDPKIGVGHIQIRLYETDNRLIVEIKDDGVGMSSDKLEQLQQKLNSHFNVLESSNHIGILNIQAQIKRRFGQDYGIRLESVDSGGLKVTIVLPRQDVSNKS